MYNVLVFPCGTEIGLEIYRSLKYARDIRLYGGSSVSSNHGKFVYENYIDGIPFFSNPGFENYLNQIIKKYKIDFLIPAHDSVALKLSEIAKDLNCVVIGAPKKTCEICRSKKKTYEIFKNIIKIPMMYNETFETNPSLLRYPLFLKPEIGEASRGTFIAQSLDDLNFYTKKNKELLIIEYLPGREFTIDCFTDRNRILKFSGARIRTRIVNGISVDTEPYSNYQLNEIAQTINSFLSFRGPWFFQVKENSDGEFVLLEIGPRIAGSMALYRNLGVNFILLAIYDFLGHDIRIIKNDYDIKMDRALTERFKLNLNFDHIYVDFDDCLITNGKINREMIQFLYQCLNNGKKLYLISKCSRNFEELLRKYPIKDIFTEIFHLDKSEKKSNYIKKFPAIFIDDSFAERVEVQEALKIPVFSPDAIESLLE
jgi:hypothetical protein